MPIYARAGVGYAWFVNPLTKTLEAYQLDGARWILLGTFRDNATLRTEPFEALTFDLGLLWAR